VATETPTRPTSTQKAKDVEKSSGERPAQSERKKRRGILKIVIFGVIALVAIVFGFSFWKHSQRYEGTDDSYVTGHSHPAQFSCQWHNF
jgi:multidrug resistance efflux pump